MRMTYAAYEKHTNSIYRSPSPAPPRRRLLLIASRCRRFQSLVNSPFCASHLWRISSDVSVRQNFRQSQPLSTIRSRGSFTRPRNPVRAFSGTG